MVTNQRNPTILLSEFQVSKAEFLLKTKRNAYYPTLSLSSGYGTNFSSERRNPFEHTLIPFMEQINQNRNLYIGLSLSIPILDGFKTKSEINRAKINIDMAKINTEKTKVREEKILQQAYQDYYKSIKENQVYQQQYISAKRHFDATKERYDIGMASPLELSSSQVNHNIAELNRIKSMFEIIYNQQVINILLES